METIEIGMGSLYIADAPIVLTTSSIGSCVAVCLWSQVSKKGALAHIMLPRRPDLADGEITAADFRYGDVAIATMISQLEAKGVNRSQLIAKIVGGANMFPGIQSRSQKVGENNVESIKRILQDMKIPLAAEETGGNVGRAISFDIANGIVQINLTI